ncbi:MAG: ATP-binding protein [Bacteroidales bacterium]|nr:ATP-binding protein [Bacteroidales bacterium]MDD3860736.1 ATP-binding protein [Bacteroidales bacterium]HOZ30167.1 ATP-binding protein [Bacteroidales bacterium]
MLKREIEDQLLEDLVPGKVVLVYGARRVGKTVLLEQLIEHHKGKVSFLNGDDYSTELLLSERTLANYRQLFTDTDLLVIDEAQNIKEIGKILKLIVDGIKDILVLVSGSSSFDLQNLAGEPLVGRALIYSLFPFSQKELLTNNTRVNLLQNIEDSLIYGSYPELLSIPSVIKKQQYLIEIANSYLLKDILMVDGIKNSVKMKDLLRLISFQIGNEVSYEELGRQLSLSRNTVEKYLDILSKTFVIYKLPAFSSNPRKEVRKTNKWYFYDNGIRNAVIGDFRALSARNDTGALWESFLISERIKFRSNRREPANFYFWRTYSGQEIDLIEEFNGELTAFECKWSKDKVKMQSVFKSLYPKADIRVVNRTNYLDILI